jgi:2-desacetyl-2-hydroxyethyl bacteriochlorophyllide A dehydrogenase
MTDRALYFDAPRSIDLREVSVGDPAADEVVIETRVSAISAGTERLIYRGEAPQEMTVDETIETLDGDLSFPLRYGYAAVGDVATVGKDVPSEWRGTTVFGFNPHQTRFCADPESLVRLPDGMSAEHGALLPTIETATNFVLDGQPRVGERVVVFGAGAIGLAITHVLADFPLETLFVVDPVESRRKVARAIGADAAVHPEHIGERLDEASPPSADLAYELSGDPETLNDVLGTVGYDSRIVVGSWYGTKSATIDLGGEFHRNNITVESSQVSTLAPSLQGRWTKARRMETAIEQLRTFDADALITHRLPFTEAPEAYRLLDTDTETAIQIILTYQ